MKNAQTQPEPLPGEGIRLEKVRPIVERILPIIVKDWEIINEKDALPEKDKPLVFVSAHGPLYAPSPMIAILAKLFLDNGYGDLTAGFYPHPFFMNIPGLRRIFAMAGTPTEVYDLQGLVDRLRDGRINITGTGPEGIYCHFSWEDYVGPFGNAGMIAAAVLSDAKLCLLAHQGGDAWNVRLNLPFGLTVPLSRGMRGVNIPIGPVRRIKRFVVSCREYKPQLAKKDLQTKSQREKRLLIGLEVERIRMELNLMTDDIIYREARRSK